MDEYNYATNASILKRKKSNYIIDLIYFIEESLKKIAIK